MGSEGAEMMLSGDALFCGFLASITAGRAGVAVTALQGHEMVLKAACTFPSVATAPVGFPVFATLLPVAFIGWVIGRKLLAIREPGILMMLILFAAPYILTGIALVRLPCRAA